MNWVIPWRMGGTLQAMNREAYEARVRARAAQGDFFQKRFDPDLYSRERVPPWATLERYPSEPDLVHPHPPENLEHGWPLGLLALLGIAGGVGWLARRKSAVSRDPSGLPRARLGR